VRVILKDGCVLARVQIHLRVREYAMANDRMLLIHGLDFMLLLLLAFSLGSWR
jgi:hypothetical protein